MSKLLIALLALDIGVSLSKVYIFAWKLNYFAITSIFFQKKMIYILGIIYFYAFYFIKLIIKPTKELLTSSKTINRAINFANPMMINQNYL